MEYDDEKIIEIFSGTLWEAEMLSSLLRDEAIESFLRNSVLNSYAYNPTFSQGVKVMISNSDFDRARKIVDDYNLKKDQTQQL